LAPKGSPAGLVSKIPLGKRAYTIEVNEQTSVSGFVLPDHRVDVIHVSNTGIAETILEDLQVLASGQVYTRPEDRSIPAKTVTLAMSPAEVDKLVAARSRGSLTLALRGPNDHERKPELPPPPPPPRDDGPPSPSQGRPRRGPRPPPPGDGAGESDQALGVNSIDHRFNRPTSRPSRSRISRSWFPLVPAEHTTWQRQKANQSSPSWRKGTEGQWPILSRIVAIPDLDRAGVT